ncbi:unnamed protein product [Closterium sp. NIES-54]
MHIIASHNSFESAAASALVAELLDFAACRVDYASALIAESVPASPPSVGGDPDAPNIPTLRSYAEAITGPYSSQWQAAMDAKMASWKSTGTYVDEVPPPGGNIVDGMWIFRVKRPPGSPPAFKARYVARGFSQRQGVEFFQTFSPTPKMTTLRVLLHVAAQRDYELHSLDFSTAFLQGSLHEEIWLRRPPGLTGSFRTGTQWSLRRPVYTLRRAPHEWHETLRTTLAALGFVPSTADPSLFLRTDTSLPPFYVLVYVDDLVFAMADTEALTLVLQRFGFQYSSPQLTPLSTSHSLSAPSSDESLEPSGPYIELVGCLITSGMGLVLGGRGPVVLTGHADASWELRWLTYLLTDLGEQPRSPPDVYVDNKAMIALCQEHRLEHRTKHIALRYFLARELQHRGQLHLAPDPNSRCHKKIKQRNTVTSSATSTTTAAASTASATASTASTAATNAPTPGTTPTTTSTSSTASSTAPSTTLASLALASAASPTRGRRSADLLSANEVDSSSRGNRGEKGDRGTPLKEGGATVAARSPNS